MALLATNNITIVDVEDGLDGRSIVSIVSSNNISRSTFRNWVAGSSLYTFSAVGRVPKDAVPGAIASISFTVTTENKKALAVGEIVSVSGASIRIKISGYVEPGENGEPGAPGTPGAPGAPGKDGRGTKSLKSYYMLTPTLSPIPTYNAASNLLKDQYLTTSRNNLLINANPNPANEKANEFVVSSYGSGSIVTEMTSPNNARAWTGSPYTFYRTDGSSGNKDIRQAVQLAANTTYTMSIWVRNRQGQTGSNPKLLLRAFGPNEAANRISDNRTLGTIPDWELYSYVFTTSVAGKYLIQFGQGPGRIMEFSMPRLIQGDIRENWSHTTLTPTATKPYLWQWQREYYTDGSWVDIGPALMAGVGTNGVDGRGVRTIDTWYLVSNSQTGITRNTTGWSKTPQIPTMDKKFIWTYIEITLTDGSKQYQGPYISGVYGDKGVQVNGTTYYTWVKYADNERGDNMSSSPAGKRYLGLAWNKESETPSNTASDYTWSPMFANPQIGGRNLFRMSLLGPSYGPTNWALVAENNYVSFTVPTNANTTWGSGIQFLYNVNHEMFMYSGETLMFSMDVKVSRDTRRRVDVNNFVRNTGGSKKATGSNDQNVETMGG